MFADIFIILAKVFTTTIKGPYRLREIFQHIYTMSIGSLPIIVVATIFAGTVVTGEIALHMDMALHTVDMVPGVTGLFIFREIGIVIPCLLLVAKVGAATAAEVSSMKVTEQIDALKLLGIDPVEYLVYPRFIASVFSTTCLTLLSIFITLICGILVSHINYGLQWQEYINRLVPFLRYSDLLCALCKGLVFGGVIPIVSCLYGFRCRGGADGVGLATTQSVVTSTLLIVILDFILTYIFSLVL